MFFENEDLMQEINDIFEKYHFELSLDIYVDAANDIKDMFNRTLCK